MTEPRDGKIVLFIHSWRDQEWFEKLNHALSATADGFIFTPFHDGELLTRADWQQESAGQVQASEAAILLVSPNLLLSDSLKEVANAFAQRKPIIKIILDSIPEGSFPLNALPGPQFPQGKGSFRSLPVHLQGRFFRSIVEELPHAPILQAEEVSQNNVSADLPFPDELVQACVSKQCVLFAGAGLGTLEGLPTPLQSVEGLLEHGLSKTKRLAPNLISSLRSLLAQGDADAVLEGITETSEDGHRAAIEYFRERLLKSTPSPLLRTVLKELAFSGVITTNLDETLESIFGMASGSVSTLQNTEQLLQAVGKNEFFLLKLHGMLNRPETVLLTSARYRDAVVGNQPFGQFLSSVYYSRSFLFAGKSLKGIEEFLQSIPSRSGAPPRHFALLPDTEPGWEVKGSSLKRRFGLEILTFPIGPDGGGLLRCLEKLRDKIRRATGGNIVVPSQVPARLAQITLENIGPFDQLKLDLAPGWNVLLGDNGVGKSSILKAIALAVAGEDAAPYAARLIRAKTTSASVTLTTDRQETYRTELYRSETGARLSSLPVRPLEKESWLALAFPPLRSVSWDRPAEYEGAQQSRPLSSDLLPLVRGEADPRLDRLKAWLLYLDHNMGQKSAPPRYAALHKKFFEVVDQVTPGVNLKPGRVDAAARQVYVITDDGEVPIEAVSQGTQSLMGWIGVVLQRLFEVYPDDADPTRRYVLVLMDEIDAHMHPQWQQALVETLKHIFPNAQFIASSHSPLVVSGLSKDEVLTFTRDNENNRRVKVERPTSDLKGWRVDQILTSPSFGLAGARDPETVRDVETYTRLAAADELDPTEQQQLEDLAAKLKVRLPTPVERSHARKAFELIQAHARDQLAVLSPEERRKLTEEIKVQIQEGMTGSERPA